MPCPRHAKPPLPPSTFSVSVCEGFVFFFFHSPRPFLSPFTQCLRVHYSLAGRVSCWCGLAYTRPNRHTVLTINSRELSAALPASLPTRKSAKLGIIRAGIPRTRLAPASDNVAVSRPRGPAARGQVAGRRALARDRQSRAPDVQRRRCRTDPEPLGPQAVLWRRADRPHDEDADPRPRQPGACQ